MGFLTLSVNMEVPVVSINTTGGPLNELLLGCPFASTVKFQRSVLQTVNTLKSSVFFHLSKILACGKLP